MVASVSLSQSLSCSGEPSTPCSSSSSSRDRDANLSPSKWKDLGWSLGWFKEDPLGVFPKLAACYFLSPLLLCAKACDGPCLCLAERSLIFRVEELSGSSSSADCNEQYPSYLLPATSAPVAELRREDWKHSLFLTLEKQCHALVGCWREISGPVRMSEACCVDVPTFCSLLLWAKGMIAHPPAPLNHLSFHFWSDEGNSTGHRHWAQTLDTSLVEPHSKGRFKPCDHKLNTSSLHHWEMLLLGRKDLEESTSWGFQSVLWGSAMRAVRKSPLPAQQFTSLWLQKRMSDMVQWQSQSNYEEKLHPPRVSWDLSLFPQQKISPNFWELHPISSVLNSCSGFGKTGIGKNCEEEENLRRRAGKCHGLR